MNSYEFLDELNEIDDDLILNAQNLPAKGCPIQRFSLRAAALAAVICLLTISAAAVTIGVRIWTEQEQVVHFEYDIGGYFPFKSKVTTIEYELEPQDVRLPLIWQTELTSAWKSFGYSYDYFSGVELRTEDGSREDFGGIDGLEQLLGIELRCNGLVQDASRRSFVTLSVTDPQRCGEQLRTDGTVTPDGLVIYLPMDLGREDIDYCGLNIFIPLTESFAHSYSSHPVLSSVYMQDLKQICLEDAVLLVNEAGERDAMSGFAAWESGGIGYLIELKTNENAQLDIAALLTPYLTETEEER